MAHYDGLPLSERSHYLAQDQPHHTPPLLAHWSQFANVHRSSSNYTLAEAACPSSAWHAAQLPDWQQQLHQHLPPSSYPGRHHHHHAAVARAQVVQPTHPSSIIPVSVFSEHVEQRCMVPPSPPSISTAIISPPPANRSLPRPSPAVSPRAAVAGPAQLRWERQEQQRQTSETRDFSLSVPPPSSAASTTTVKMEPDDSENDRFIVDFATPPTPTAQGQRGCAVAPAAEVPLRATQAPKEMRKMMSVFRLNPFAMHDGSGKGGVVSSAAWYAEEIGPLQHTPLVLEFQLEVDGTQEEEDGAVAFNVKGEELHLRAFSPDFELDGNDVLDGAAGGVVCHRGDNVLTSRTRSDWSGAPECAFPPAASSLERWAGGSPLSSGQPSSPSGSSQSSQIPSSRHHPMHRRAQTDHQQRSRTMTSATTMTDQQARPPTGIRASTEANAHATANNARSGRRLPTDSPPSHGYLGDSAPPVASRGMNCSDRRGQIHHSQQQQQQQQHHYNDHYQLQHHHETMATTATTSARRWSLPTAHDPIVLR